MKITEVRVYGKLLPMASSYNMSSAAVGEPDTTIVELVTDTAYVGWGEICPTGPLPQPEHAGSIRADLVLLCPALIGLDPRQLGLVHDAMALRRTRGRGGNSCRGRGDSACSCCLPLFCAGAESCGLKAELIKGFLLHEDRSCKLLLCDAHQKFASALGVGIYRRGFATEWV